ncbi:hypothetical protein MBM09_14485 [Flaviramulus sp. BrNp1-15]|uniref:hypothetical protein n=1 Tax=Flaviramulus sp. BrNp1-15 TaxID=2916754 RepID=UPI001EE93EE2|nr:hypothetical protein [Flaviramulus sp. BrNp1-15]ULC59107.1 hypothetical protein MBM09_14485 [Flaviramulus sp. BrNp1-15]
MIIFNSQSGFGINTSQYPQQIRQFDDDFKERYSGNKFNYEGEEIVTKTPSGSGNYENYKKAEDHRKERNNSDSFSINLGPFSWLFYLAIALAVIYLVYILLNEGGTGLFSSNGHNKLNTYEEITAENIENTDINSLIINAEKSNDFRLAIRYYYLLVLKNLSLKNYIKFEDDKTNSEYLNEIDSKPFSDKFAYTSYLYNYIWYGEFPLDVEEYNKAKGNFLTLLNEVK